MELWLDTSNINLVTHANGFGILQGVTTNPSILSQAKACSQDLIFELLDAQKGVVAVQILAEDEIEIYKQAKVLSAISDRILVKIPVTQNGIRAISTLSQEGVPTLATAIFTSQQTLLAFKAGANYLAPYLGRIGDTGKNPIQIISQMLSLKKNYGFNGKIMGAGIRDLTTAMTCLEMGICAMTLSEKIFNEFIQDYEPTLLALEKFSEDWSTSVFSKSNSTFFLTSAPTSFTSGAIKNVG